MMLHDHPRGPHYNTDNDGSAFEWTGDGKKFPPLVTAIGLIVFCAAAWAGAWHLLFH